jgi:hypothetical protein
MSKKRARPPGSQSIAGAGAPEQRRHTRARHMPKRRAGTKKGWRRSAN